MALLLCERQQNWLRAVTVVFRTIGIYMLLLLRFFTFLRFFKIQKVVTFYVFCRVSYVFSNYGFSSRLTPATSATAGAEPQTSIVYTEKETKYKAREIWQESRRKVNKPAKPLTRRNRVIGYYRPVFMANITHLMYTWCWLCLWLRPLWWVNNEDVHSER